MKIIIKIKTNNNECAHIYINVNDKVVENGSKKTDWDIPLGIVNETIWELKRPKF